MNVMSYLGLREQSFVLAGRISVFKIMQSFVLAGLRCSCSICCLIHALLFYFLYIILHFMKYSILFVSNNPRMANEKISSFM